MIRIIAGTYRHRHLNQPESPQVRPTMDRIRESVFSALGPLEGLHVLDLFAGSGAYGFEALSRGAQHVVFVDALKLATQAIQKTIAEFEISQERVTVLLDDYRKALKKLNQTFDLVFADPPYAMNNSGAKLLSTLAADQLLNSQARVVIESLEEPAISSDYTAKTYKYGKKFVTVYRRIK